ncbi:MAG: Lrp/AsnC family transcriptional regulator [Nanoarchaeota archaeon]
MPQETAILLDKIDKKLLFELDMNARASNAALARSIKGVSKQGIAYKITQLQKKGVITGYYPVIETHKLGFVYGRILLKLQNLTVPEKEALYNKLSADKIINWILKCEGRFDLLVGFLAKNITDFKQTSRQLLQKYGSYIKESRESVTINITHLQNRYILQKIEGKSLIFKETTIKYKISKIELDILKILINNSRMPIVEIAQKLKTKPKIVSYYLRKMERSGLILCYRPAIDHKKLGFTHYKVLFYLIGIDQKELERFRNYLINKPEVIYIVDEIGICDIDIEMMISTSQQFFKFFDDIKAEFPKLVRDYDVLIADRTLKLELLPWQMKI